jgi:hypothetical protein
MVLTGFDRHCEERSDAASQGGRAGAAVSGLLRFARNDEPKRVRRDRHCEERSDAAIQGGRAGAAVSGLLRFARNDEPKRVRR